METLKKNPSIRRKSKLARTFQKVCNLRTTSTKVSSNNGIGICMLKSQNPNFDDEDDDGDSVFDLKSTSSSRSGEIKVKERRRAVLEAVVAKIFASTTSIKAAYAELQVAQRPYDNDAIQAADTAVVDELRALSELKRSFLRKELNLSPQVAIMLAEIQEQQSLMRTYEITIKKLESEVSEKQLRIDSLKTNHEENSAFNKSLEKKLTASGSISVLDNIQFSNLNLSHFVQTLGFTLRSVRSFVKTMVKEMESARWDLDAAASAAISINVRNASTVFARPSHRCFAFESFVCGKMLENFEFPNFSLRNEKSNRKQFENLRSVDPVQYLTRNPGSSFAKFTLHKYLSVVHAKMECSFFGSLNQRKLVNSGGFPDSGFFATFCEMAKRIWLLHCLAFSLSENVTVFQLKRGCRFSQVSMESVKSGDESLISGDNEDIRVGFTVVPGFKIGDNVIQSQVYLTPVTGFPPPVTS
ncbi:Protein GRAVITROPIC IN THE LIGHT 1 [Cardamine amara subsp. amara]|uniref:Protein GRAVITROPIC IN THE LIGHT 1 n=1 Tax=Cardamine amara subsp. amara TaxID=228776 RepID=A0ABD1B1J9_CARAN